MWRRKPSLVEDEALGWPNSIYYGHELEDPLDALPLTALETDGATRTPHRGEADVLLKLRARTCGGWEP